MAVTYDVVFDVSQRIPQLGIGIVAAIALAIVIVVGLLDVETLIVGWPIVFGLGAVLLVLQWLVVDAWPYAVAAAVLVVVVVLVGQSDAIREAPPGKLPRGSRRTMMGTALLLLVAFLGLPMVSAIDLQRRLNEGQATVLEGPVSFEGFVKTECMTVSGYRYCYSETTVTPGYNRMRYLAGALESGMQVRASVIDDLIVRLEIASSPK
jgi:hypothetical protein